MFKIGEFSQLVRVSPRMLRHYEKCGLISPAATHPFTGYRQYSAAQIPQIGRIAALRDAGFSIDEIGGILPRMDDKAFLEGLLREKACALRAAIEQDHARLTKLMQMSGELRKEQTIMVYEVELKKLEAVKVLALRGIIPQYNQEGILWEKLGMYIAENNIACHGDGYSTYFDETYMEANPDVEIAVPVDTLGESRGEFVYKEYPAVELAATLRFSGPFDGGYDAAGEKLAKWMEASGYTFAGNLRGHVLTSPDDESNSEKWLTELQVPVKKVS
jgi:DNA-binding transcriptional MerR regulator